MSEAPTSDDQASAKAVSSVHLAPGFTVGGKYVIKKLLGEGANGSVYEGEHSQIGHRVAIKVVHKSLAERDDITARFQREARICGTIRNRHVGQVYDVGQLPEGGAPYMVMELHEGRSLSQVLADDGPLPIAAVIDVVRQLLVGLQAAHDTSVIHRDIKPDNIMLVRESSGQVVVKLVDFGIGKAISTDIRARNVTQEGMVVGSPDYMPPEQLKGENVDHRVDIYATGVVLYEAVTGRVPFNAGSLTELFVAILRDPVSPPRTHRPDCPPELESVIQRAMARDAGQRFQSANEMGKALETIARDCGLGADGLSRYSRPPPSATGSRKQARSSSSIAEGGYALETERVRTAELQIPGRRAGGRVVVVAASVLIAGVGLAWMLRSAQDGTPHQVLPKQELHAAASATPVPAAVPEPAPAAAPLRPASETGHTPEVAPRGEVEAHEQANDPTAEVARASPPAAGSLGVVVRSDASRGDKKGRKHLASAAEGAEHGPAEAKHPALTGPELAEAQKAAPHAAAPAAAASQNSAAPTELLQQAAAAFVRGQMPRARALYREASQKAPGSADGWRGLGMVSSRMGEPEEAARAFKRYLALRPNAPDADQIRKKLAEL
jgi:serine/threonine protein kinase